MSLPSRHELLQCGVPRLQLSESSVLLVTVIDKTFRSSDKFVEDRLQRTAVIV